MERQVNSLFMLIFDYLMLAFVAFNAFTGEIEGFGKAWYIWLLSYVISDALAWIQQEKQRPFTVEELAQYTKQIPSYLGLLQKLYRFLSTFVLIFVFIALFNSSWAVYLGYASLARLVVLSLFVMGINHSMKKVKETK